jgi:hypothetical protein
MKKTTAVLGSVDWKAEEQTPDMNSGDEGSGKLCVARGNSPPALEGAEDIFNDVPDTVHDCTLFALSGF